MILIIMHQNSLIADEVGIEVSDFKVINLYRLCQFFKLCTCYESRWTVNEVYLVTFNKIACCNPTSVNNIEWVVCSCIDIIGCCVKKKAEALRLSRPRLKSLNKIISVTALSLESGQVLVYDTLSCFRHVIRKDIFIHGVVTSIPGYPNINHLN